MAERIKLRTVIHWRELIRCVGICGVLIPVLLGGLISLVGLVVDIPVWVAALAGLVVGVSSTQIYIAIRPPLWHFEVR